MKTVPVSRRVFLQSSRAIAAGLILSPAIIGRAQAATVVKLQLSNYEVVSGSWPPLLRSVGEKAAMRRRRVTDRLTLQQNIEGFKG
jgi:hypothetical protein